MSAQASTPTVKPIVAGIFNIVVGGGILLAMLIFGIAALVVSAVTIPFVGFVIAIVALPVLAIGVLALLGGIYAIQRRMWGWALAGSIAAAIASNVLGVASIVLVAVSKEEFSDNK